MKSIRKIVDELSLNIDLIEETVKNSQDKSVEVFIEKLNEEVNFLSLDCDKLKEFVDAYKKISIINPNKYKFHDTVLEQHYYQLIRSFSYELEKKQSVLIIFGFSFADEHLKDIFERSLLNPELQVILISYSKRDQDRLRVLFNGYNNIKFLPETFEANIKGDFKYLLSLLGDYNEK